MSGNGNNGAPQKGDALAPFKRRLAKQQGKLRQLLPDYMAPERYLSLAMLAIYREPKLQQACIEAPDTVIDSILRGAQCGFEIGGPVPGAHLVPFYAKLPGSDRKAMQCVMIPDYRGLINLAVDAGSIVSGDARLVYEGEKFEVMYGTEAKIVHVPDFAAIDAGKIVAAYFVAKLPSGGTQFEVMTYDQIMKIKARSRAGANGPWVTDFGEMAKKTVTKRGLKYVPMSPNSRASRQLALALEADNRFETGEVGVLVPEWGEDEDTASALAAERTKSNLESLRERIHGRDVTEQAEAQAQEQAVRRTVAPNDAEPWPDDEPAAEEEPWPEPEPRQQPTTQRRGASRQQAQRAAAAAAPRAREPGEDDDDEMP